MELFLLLGVALLALLALWVAWRVFCFILAVILGGLVLLKIGREQRRRLGR